MPPAVSVIIANWNGRHHLAACLPALRAQTLAPAEIIVVDNGSTDGSLAWLAQQSDVQVIANDRNLGFAAANNQGLRAATSDYLALLNNDTRPEPGWLAALARALAADPRLGMAASLMLFADQPNVVNSTGVCVDRCGISWDRAGGQPAPTKAEGVIDVFGASAGAALYRRELLDEVGHFDESFFAYLEDVDLAWRARWHGWGAVCVPAARVYHAHSATGGEGSAFKTYWLARNKILLLAKNYPLPHLWAYLPLILAYDTLSLLHALWRQRNLSPLRGRLAGWRGVGQAWRFGKARRVAAPGRAAAVFAGLAPVAWPWRLQRQRYGHLDQRRLPG